jgi:hypothetical protein
MDTCGMARESSLITLLKGPSGIPEQVMREPRPQLEGSGRIRYPQFVVQQHILPMPEFKDDLQSPADNETNLTWFIKLSIVSYFYLKW